MGDDAAAARRRRAAPARGPPRPGAKHQPATNSAVPAPTASSAGSGASRWTCRSPAAVTRIAGAPYTADSLRPCGSPTPAAGAGRAPRRRPRTGPARRLARAPHGERLAAIDAACAGGGPRALRAVPRPRRRPLGAAADPGVRRLPATSARCCPSVPDPACRSSGTAPAALALAEPEHGVLPTAARALRRHDARPGRRARARLRLRLGAADRASSPATSRPARCTAATRSQQILDVCRETGVPAKLARSDFVPERLPFDEPFDLAFAFSVFTHLSEARARALPAGAARGAARPAALLVRHGPPARPTSALDR